MKTLFTLLGIIVLLSGCNKNETPELPNSNLLLDYTPIPSPESVNTNIIGFATDDNNQSLTGSNQALINNSVYTIATDGSFTTGEISVDRYTAKSYLNVNGVYLNTYKTFPVTTSKINYVSFKVAKPLYIGNIVNGNGGTITYQGCSITFLPNSLYELPYLNFPGFVNPGSVGSIKATYLNPTFNDFAVRLPCYAMADEDQKRWFLKSYGMSGLKMESGSFREMDFYNNATGTLKIPIPAAMLSNAPDSVVKWILTEGTWKKNGFAKKINNNYEATINKLATYNFASAVNGVYRTVKLRTDSGSNIINTTIRIKNSTATLAESQTDGDGNAICFVPSNETLTIEVLNTGNYNPTNNNFPIYTTTIPTTNTSGNIEIVLPANVLNLYTFKGIANACNGSSIQNGMVSVKIQNYPSRKYYIPVQNGTFNAAIYVDGSDYLAWLKPTNLTTGETGTDTAVLPLKFKQNYYTLNSCTAPTNTFINYSVDNVSYSFSGDISTPYNPILDAYSSSYTLVSTTNNAGKSLQFATGATQVGTFLGSGISSLFIDGIYYIFDLNKPMKVIFSRYDPVNNGFIIGSADFYYYRSTTPTVSHHLVTSFKLRRQ